MRPDPVVEEIRQIGARIAEECDFDIHKLAERYRQAQKKRGEQDLIRQPFRRSARFPKEWS